MTQRDCVGHIGARTAKPHTQTTSPKALFAAPGGVPSVAWTDAALNALGTLSTDSLAVCTAYLARELFSRGDFRGISPKAFACMLFDAAQEVPE